MTLHSALIKTHEETDISPHSVIYRPVGSTRQLVTKLSPPNFAVLQDHRYLEIPILGVQRRFRDKSQHPNSQFPHTSNSVQDCVLSPTTCPRVLYTYVGIHLYILGVYRSRALLYIRTLPVLPEKVPKLNI